MEMVDSTLIPLLLVQRKTIVDPVWKEGEENVQNPHVSQSARRSAFFSVFRNAAREQVWLCIE
jgi:hypothetical protein